MNKKTGLLPSSRVIKSQEHQWIGSLGLFAGLFPPGRKERLKIYFIQSTQALTEKTILVAGMDRGTPGRNTCFVTATSDENQRQRVTIFQKRKLHHTFKAGLLFLIRAKNLHTCTTGCSREVHVEGKCGNPFCFSKSKHLLIQTPGLSPEANLKHKWPTKWAFRSHLFQPLSNTSGFYEQNSNSWPGDFNKLHHLFIQVPSVPSFLPPRPSWGWDSEVNFLFSLGTVPFPLQLVSEVGERRGGGRRDSG